MADYDIFTKFYDLVKFAENVMIMDVKPGADDDVSLWDIRIFEPREDGLFRLHRERISELGVPLAQIREALSKNFPLLEEASPDEGPVTDKSPRVFFACRNRLAPRML